VILGGYTNDFAADVYVYEQNNLEKTSPLLHPLADAKFFRIGDKIVGTGGEAAPGIRGKWTMEAEIPAAWGGR
jgi:N-acetylneuraminic acid mutarotase